MYRASIVLVLSLLAVSEALSIDDFYPFGEENDTTPLASVTAAPPPTKPANKLTHWHCDNHGAPGCKCTPGWTGDRCYIPIDYCTHPPQVLKDDVMLVVPFCGENGYCNYTSLTGSKCVCNEGFYGDFCQHMNKTKRVSDRCIMGRTKYTMRNEQNKTAVETTNQCNIGSEICVPDNMNCYNNYPPRFNDGEPYCDQGWEYNDRSMKCQCQYPIGWCIPAEAGGYLVRNFFKARAQAMLSCNQSNPLMNSQQNVDSEQLLEQLMVNAARMYQDDQYTSGTEPTTERAYTAPWWMDTTEYERISSPQPTEPSRRPSTHWPSEVSTGGHTDFEWPTAGPDYPDTTDESGYSEPVKPGSVVCSAEAVSFNLDTRSYIWSTLGASGELVIRLNTSSPDCSEYLTFDNVLPPFVRPPRSDPTLVNVSHASCPYPIVPIYMNETEPVEYGIALFLFAQHAVFDSVNCSGESIDNCISTDGPEFPFQVYCILPAESELNTPQPTEMGTTNYWDRSPTTNEPWLSEVSTDHTHFEWPTAGPDYPDTAIGIECNAYGLEFRLNTDGDIWERLGASKELAIWANSGNCSNRLIYTNVRIPFRPPSRDPTRVVLSHVLCPYEISGRYDSNNSLIEYDINVEFVARKVWFDPSNCPAEDSYICNDGQVFPSLFRVSCAFVPGRTDFACANNGEPYCTCEPGWSGPECKTPIDYCHNTPPQVQQNHTMITVPFCGENGHCDYDMIHGTSCHCDEGFYGDFCQHMRKSKYVADRCIMRATQYTNQYQNDPSHVPRVETVYECNKEGSAAEICIPDDMDCYRSTPSVAHMYGDMRCHAGRELDPATQRCICQYPVGWCIPSHVANTVVKNYFKEDTKKALTQTST